MIKKNILFLFVFFAFMCIASSVVMAAKQTIRLSQIAPVKNLRLQSIKNTATISIPVPLRWHVKGATLRFSYINSTALLAYKSRLTVLMDDIPLAQLRLEPQTPEGTATVNIPSGLMRPGYHSLVFATALHSEKECEDPFAPELWTVLKLGEATITIDYSVKALPMKLSAIPSFILDARQIPQARINLVLGSITPDSLQTANIIAGGIGARLQYRPAVLSVSKQLIPGMDNIVIGRKSLVTQLTDYKEPLVDGPIIRIYHMPGNESNNVTQTVSVKPDRTHCMIIVSGRNPSEIKKAALSFASISFPFPQTREMLVKKLHLPNIPTYSRKGVVIPGIPATFTDMGFDTKVFQGLNNQPAFLTFNLPPDLYIEPNEYAVFLLHFAYSAACRKDSSIKITLNGTPVNSIHLDNENGAAYEGYKVTVPTYMFKPGKNRIEFQSSLVPLIIKRCEAFQDMNLFLTLFDDSVIRFPAMGHWAELPALELFLGSGFPFLQSIDGKDSMIYLTKPDLKYAGLAMNLSAYFGQINGYAPVNLKFSFEPPKTEHTEILTIGTIKSLPPGYLEKAPLKLMKTVDILYPQFNTVLDWHRHSWLQRTEEKFESFTRLFPLKNRPIEIPVSELRGRLDDDTGLLMEFESPHAKGSSVIVWTAKNAKAFDSISRLLWLGRLRSSVTGDLALFSLSNPDKVTALKLGPKYHTGKLQNTERVTFYLRSYPWIYLTILSVSIVTLAVLLAIYLRKRRKKRLSGQE